MNLRDIKTQRNILGLAVIVLLVLVGLLLGGVITPGTAGGKGNAYGNSKGTGNCANNPNKTCVTSDDNLSPGTAGQSVVGADALLSGLNIHDSGGNDVVLVTADNGPAAFGGGADNIVNDCLGGSGIADVGIPGQTWQSKKHQYVFTFDDTTVSSFSIGVVDWGDFLPLGRNSSGDNVMVLTAYDASGVVVSQDVYTFNTGSSSAKVSRPVVSVNGQAVNLNTYDFGDACMAAAGDSGNYTFHVQGQGIVRVTLNFQDSASEDPHIALTLPQFQPEESGFVTGGGFITFADETTANFGFNAREAADNASASGELEYNWNENAMNFHAHDVTELTCSSADGTATWYGSGATINGDGNYNYQVWITDGKWTGSQGGGGGDLFRILITDESGAVIHDSGTLEPGFQGNGQGGGAIVLHKCGPAYTP